MLVGHQDSVLCLSVRDTESVLSGSEDGTARLWDMRSQRATRCLSAFNKQAVSSVVSDARNEFLVHCAAGNQMFQFDLRNPLIVLRDAQRTFTSTQEIAQICSHTRQRVLGACDEDGNAFVIDADTYEAPRRLREKHGNMCSSVLFRSQWEVFTGGFDCVLRLHDFSKGKLVREWNFALNGSGMIINPPFVHNLALSFDERLVACALGDGSVAVIRSAAQPPTLISPHLAPVADVAFAHFDPSRVWSVGNDKILVLSALPHATTAEKSRKGSKKRSNKPTHNPEQTKGQDEEGEDAQAPALLRVDLQSKPNAVGVLSSEVVLVAGTDNQIQIVRLGR
eukprot:c12739_g1_i1.p1 GENE.c12739_g1_i1~~c12739_g1_i1.p1  ORF type:complete len:337 (+),score=74.66 c12739_g1_i1:42-1052(+)